MSDASQDQSTPAKMEKQSDAKANLLKWQIALVFVFGVSQAAYYWYPRFEKKNGPEFILKAESFEMTFPDQLKDDIREIQTFCHDLQHSVDLDDIRNKGKGEHAATKEVTAKKEALDAVFKRIDDFRYLNGQLRVTLRNKGTLAANDSRIQMPRSGIAKVKWDDGTVETIAFTKDIPLGAIPIEKEVTVTAWTSRKLSDYDLPLLVHSTGTVEIPLPKLVPEIETSFASSLFGLLGPILFGVLVGFALPTKALAKNN